MGFFYSLEISLEYEIHVMLGSIQDYFWQDCSSLYL